MMPRRWINPARFHASLLALAMSSAIVYAAAPPTPVVETAADEGVATSPDRRYRVVGTITPTSTPASPHTKPRVSAKSGYQLEGGIVGVIADEKNDEGDTREVTPHAKPEPKPDRDRSSSLLDVLSHWGTCGSAHSSGCAGDLDADGFVGPEDLIAAIQESGD